MKKSLILSRNIIINFVSQIITFLVTFFTLPIILKGLGQTKYSLLIFLTTIVNFLIAFDFGFSPAFVQALSQKTGEDKKSNVIFWTSFLFYILIAVFWSIMIYITAPILLSKLFPIVQQVEFPAVSALRTFSLVLFISIIANFFSLTFRALQKFHLSNLRTIFLGTAIPIGSVWLLKNNYGLREIIFLHLYVQIFITIVLFIILKRFHLFKEKIFFSLISFKQLFSFAKWKFIGQLSGQIRQKANRFFLGFYLSLDSLAIFVIPQNLVERYASILPNFTTPIFTMTAKLTGEKKDQALLKLYKSSAKLINIFLLPIGIFLYFYAFEFLNLWLGSGFAHQGTMILKILSIAFSLAILNGLPVVFLEGKGRPALPAKYSLLIVFLYIIFSFLLIPKYGLIGAAWVNLFTFLIQVPIFLTTATRKILGKVNLKFYLTSYLFPIFLAVLSANFLNLYKRKVTTWFSFIASGVAYLIIYAALVFVFKLINKEEKKYIKEIWQSLQLF